MEPPSLEGNLHGEDRNPVPLPNHWDTKLELVPYWEGGSGRALGTGLPPNAASISTPGVFQNAPCGR